MPIRYWLLLILVGGLFGSSFFLIAITSREVAPLTMAAGRSLVAAGLSWSIVLVFRRLVPTEPLLIAKLLGLGVISYAASFVLMPIIQQHISTALVSMLNLLLPIFTLAVSHVWPGGERARPHKAWGAIIGLGGAFVLVTPTLGHGLGGQVIGVLLCLGRTLLFAVAFNVTRSFSRLSPQTVAAFAMTGVAMVTVPIAIVSEGLPHVQHVETIWAWLALSVLPTTLTFRVMYWMLPKIGATNFSVNSYISPIVATGLGVLVLGEAVYPLQLVGMAIVVAGLLVIDWRIIQAFRRTIGSPAAETTGR